MPGGAGAPTAAFLRRVAWRLTAAAPLPSIAQAGGFVASNRVCQCLAVSRALGDHNFKDAKFDAHKQMVTCVPVGSPAGRRTWRGRRDWVSAP